MNSSKTRLAIFMLVFLLLNLAFVPLLSVYGLSVCPVLRVSGFLLGCAYSGVYVGVLYLTNLALILVQFRIGKPKAWLYPTAYLVATILSLVFLQRFLNIQHASSHSRAPQILILASVLLGITQYYGLAWVLKLSNPKIRQLSSVWRRHSLKTMLPSIAVVLTLLHFVLTQGRMMRENFSTAESIVEGTSILILFLSVWSVLTYLFYFLAEFDAVKAIAQSMRTIVHLKLAIPFYYVSKN